MSYAGPTPRPHGHDKSGNRKSTAASRSAPSRPRSPSIGQPSDAVAERDWQQVAIFGAGLALGIAVGAGAALLTAPRTGAETRAVLTAGIGRVRRTTARRGRDAWGEMRDELRDARRKLQRRKARRALERESEL